MEERAIFTAESLSELSRQIWKATTARELGQAIRSVNKLLEAELQAASTPEDLPPDSSTRMLSKTWLLTVQRTYSEQTGSQKMLTGSWQDADGSRWQLTARSEMDPISPGIFHIQIVKDRQARKIEAEEIQKALRSI